MSKRTWSPMHDDYGRRAQALRVDGHVVGVVVRLPRVYTETYGPTHLSNDWSVRGDAAVRYHQSLAAAKARVEAL